MNLQYIFGETTLNCCSGDVLNLLYINSYSFIDWSSYEYIVISISRGMFGHQTDSSSGAHILVNPPP